MSPDLLMTMLSLLIFVVFAYFLIYRPEKKRKEAYNQMLSSLEVNDEILTKGGIVGKVIKFQDDDFMIVEVGPDRTRLRFVKDCVLSNLTKNNINTEASKEEKTEK